MPLNFVRNDIVDIPADAYINPANTALKNTGGVGAAIFKAAGTKLDAACRDLAPCPVGQCVITPGFHSRARYIIHAVSPIWHNRPEDETLLRCCYRTALDMAAAQKLTSVAFTLLGSGASGFPPEAAIRIAVSEIGLWLDSNADIDVTLVLFDRRSAGAAASFDIPMEEYIDDSYADDHAPEINRRPLFQRVAECAPPRRADTLFRRSHADEACLPNDYDEDLSEGGIFAACPPCASLSSLDDELADIGESFHDRLFRLIDERGLKDADVYKHANIDRRLFSRIRSNPNYHPAKNTVLALSVSLKLTEEETRDLLESAGYAFSAANRFDIVVRYCIQHRQLNINDINLQLYARSLPLLGA